MIKQFTKNMFYTLCLLFVFINVYQCINERKEKIQMFKKLVLRKLDMLRPPPGKMPRDIPKALAERGNQLPSQFTDEELNSFSGKVFINARREGGGVFAFDLSGISPSQKIVSVQMYAHTSMNFAKGKRRRARVILVENNSESTEENLVGVLPLSSRIAARRLELTTTLQDWQDDSPNEHIFRLKIVCKGQKHCLSSTDADPFLEVSYTQQYVRHRRQTKICKNGECCVQNMDVTVNDLDWSDWFLAPRKLQITYCAGRCNKKGRARAVQYMSLMTKKTVPEGGCCMPTELRDLKIMHTTGNETAYIRHLENIVVTRCGCF